MYNYIIGTCSYVVNALVELQKAQQILYTRIRINIAQLPPLEFVQTTQKELPRRFS